MSVSSNVEKSCTTVQVLKFCFHAARLSQLFKVVLSNSYPGVLKVIYMFFFGH